jgi:hypothetical protein
MGALVYRGHEKEFQQNVNGYKQGASVTVPAPIYYRVKDGATMDTVAPYERDLTFTVNVRKHVAWPITAQEMTLNIDKFSERHIKPAMQALSNYIDQDLLSMYKQIPNQVGTPGTTPSQFYTIAEAAAVLADHAAPQDNRACILDPWAQVKLADQLKGLLLPTMVNKAITKASFGHLATFDMYMSQNVNSHTVGTGGGTTTSLMDGATAEGATGLVVDENGSVSLIFNEGDILTVANVNGVNPISGLSTSRLRQFVVRTTTTASGTEDTISTTPGVSPNQIYSSAAGEDYLPYQTIDTLPADDAAVSCAGTSGLVHKVNLAFHRDCIGLVMVPLTIPASVGWSAQESNEGYSIRVIRDYDVINDQEYIRFDVLYGRMVINPFLGCRIAG